MYQKPFHVMAKPIGPICNLNCQYCYYLKKKNLYPDTENFRIDEDLLKRHIENIIFNHSKYTHEIHFAWQGGEPSLLGLDFFHKVIEYQNTLKPSQSRIINSFQTNGILIDEKWAKFFHKEKFLIGISIDGPAELHDANRKKKSGKGSHAEVMLAIKTLKKYQVDFNTLTVVNSKNVYFGHEVYSFLRKIGSRYMQFIPLLIEQNGEIGTESLKPAGYGRFMNAILDEWLRREDIGKVFVQLIDVLLGIELEQPAALCVFANNCGGKVIMEHNGDVYNCDHFVEKNHLIGNLNNSDYSELLDKKVHEKFAGSKISGLVEKCHNCRHLKKCYGGCPKHRILSTDESGKSLNYFCKSYQLIFRHYGKTLKSMANCIRQGGSPAKFLKK